MSIIIPFKRAEEKIGKFKELTPEAQGLLLKIIDYAFEQRNPDMHPAEFRHAVIEMLESGEAYLDVGEQGIALKLAKQSDLLV